MSKGNSQDPSHEFFQLRKKQKWVESLYISVNVEFSTAMAITCREFDRLSCDR